MDCRDRFAVWLVELVLEPVRALRENGSAGSVTVRAACGARRFDVTIARNGAGYRWAFREVAAPGGGSGRAAQGRGRRAARRSRGCVLGRLDGDRSRGLRIAIVIFEVPRSSTAPGRGRCSPRGRAVARRRRRGLHRRRRRDSDHLREGPPRARRPHVGVAPAPDVVLWPGGQERETSSATKRVRDRSGRSPRAAADDERLHRLARLRGRGSARRPPATTYLGALDRLAELGKDIEVAAEAGSSTTATWSPLPASRPGSTWLCTSCGVCTRRNAPATCAATSSTTRSRRSRQTD